MLLVWYLIWPLAACPTHGSGQTGLKDDSSALAVSPEVYDRTFDEIKLFLKRMDAIIASQDFKLWKASCTAGYLTYNSNPERLQELSQRPFLKDNHIVLKSLEDFFYHVFIPSRTQTTLDKIDFIENNRVKAITVIGGTPYVVYLLEKDEKNEWKIGVW